MPKNRDKTIRSDSKELILADEDQVYALVAKAYGNMWLGGMCSDGRERKFHIRGKMTSKYRGNQNRINEGDIVLVSLRNFQDDKGDCIHKYSHEEVKKLRQLGHIPNNFSTIVEEEKTEESFDFSNI